MKIPEGEEDPDGGISEISPYISRPVIGQHTGCLDKLQAARVIREQVFHEGMCRERTERALSCC